DKWQDERPAGYYPGNNFQPITTPFFTDYARASYGINVDITSCLDPQNNNKSVFNDNGIIGVVDGPNQQKYGATRIGDALDGRLDRVARGAEVLLFADAGVRPYLAVSLLDRRDVLYITTNYMTGNGGDPALWGT